MSIWPPPPDLHSLKELFAAADVEGLISNDCPPDEYDPEATHFHELTRGRPASAFSEEQTFPLLEELWTRQFTLDEAQLAKRRPALRQLSQQIARFFGPGAQPEVRQKPSS